MKPTSTDKNLLAILALLLAVLLTVTLNHEVLGALGYAVTLRDCLTLSLVFMSLRLGFRALSTKEPLS